MYSVFTRDDSSIGADSEVPKPVASSKSFKWISKQWGTGSVSKAADAACKMSRHLHLQELVERPGAIRRRNHRPETVQHRRSGGNRLQPELELERRHLAVESYI